MNQIVLMGRLTKDPDLKYTSGNNTATASFSIAVNRERAKEGQQQADFINIVTWNKTAEFVQKYMTKGMQIALIGRLQTRTWEKDGQKHYVTEVVADHVYFADSKRTNLTDSKPDSYEPPKNSDDPFSYDPFANDQDPF